jgi:D-proline reductase (dithiol) PrdB
MAELTELSLSSRLLLKTYSWRRIDPVPGAPLRRPLSEAKVALVSTAGLVLPSQAPFDHEIRGGDWTFRQIPEETDPAVLLDTHRSGTYDHAGVQADPNLAFPIERLRELAAEGVVGSVNGRHFSFMGSITAPGRLVAESAPVAADALAADAVDAVLLIPI